jgi:hypothetical protein
MFRNPNWISWDLIFCERAGISFRLWLPHPDTTEPGYERQLHDVSIIILSIPGYLLNTSIGLILPDMQPI